MLFLLIGLPSFNCAASMTNPEIQNLRYTLQQLLWGEPWYGPPATEILALISGADCYAHIASHVHSPIELLYHMNSWATFTLRWIENDPTLRPEDLESMDWIVIDPEKHNWEDGMARFWQTHDMVLDKLDKKPDGWLDCRVPFKTYDFRFLLGGLIQHNVYHLGQLVLLARLLSWPATDT